MWSNWGRENLPNLSTILQQGQCTAGLLAKPVWLQAHSKCSSYFSCWCVKRSWQMKLNVGSFYFGLEFEGPIYHGWEAHCQQHEAVCHIASTVKKQKSAIDTQTDFSLVFSLEQKPRKWHHPVWVGLPISISLINLISYSLLQMLTNQINLSEAFLLRHLDTVNLIIIK